MIVFPNGVVQILVVESDFHEDFVGERGIYLLIGYFRFFSFLVFGLFIPFDSSFGVHECVDLTFSYTV